MKQELKVSVALLWTRVLIGFSMASHGYGKVFGGRIEGFSQGISDMGFPFPTFFAWAASLAELVGGVCLALGIGTQVAAGFIFITMSVALFIRHAPDPFKVKELAYMYWVITGAITLCGGGQFTLSKLLFKKKSEGYSIPL